MGGHWLTCHVLQGIMLNYIIVDPIPEAYISSTLRAWVRMLRPRLELCLVILARGQA